MNITELARKLNVSPEELRDKLPDLGFSIGRKAIKVDNRVADKIMKAWGEMKRKEKLAKKVKEQKKKTRKTDDEEEEVDDSREVVRLPDVITVRDFASRLDMPVPKLMKELMGNGILASINERLDYDTAAIIAEDLGYAPEAEMQDGAEAEQEDAERIREIIEEEAEKNGEPRPPVIVVMGHVDHGKTKLLDTIRSENVAESEAGGITQHIGAYQVEHNDKKLTFIDTPGHEAFTVMRSRGAKVADLAILVVAADDGVQPQTKEAVDIIRSAELPFVVALNKIDRKEADLDRAKSELSELDLIPEEWSGETVMVPISAKENTNIDQLLDSLLLVSEMNENEIQANPNRRAIGTVIESHVDPGAGPLATVLVQTGTLEVGDDLGIRETNYGRVRAMKNWKGHEAEEAVPSMPVEVLGWKRAPAVGDIMEVPKDVAELDRIKSTDMKAQATEEVASIQKIGQDEEDDEDGKNYLKIIVRADVLGSLEALLGMFDTIQHDEVGVKVVSKGLGNLTEKDILDASASDAIIYGFSVEPNKMAESMARDKDVEIRTYDVIYKLFENVMEELQTLLPSETVIDELGRMKVMANFRKKDNGWIVGGKALEGKLLPGTKMRMRRNDEYIGEGKVTRLQTGQSEAKQIRAGQQCGLEYIGDVKAEPGDVIEVYEEGEESRKLKIEGISKR